MSYLKTETVEVESLGESLEIRELSARAQVEIIEAQDRPFDSVFIACRYGVPAWSDRSVDDIKDSMTLAQATDVAGHVFRLSGIDLGN